MEDTLKTEEVFRFKRFNIRQGDCLMKVSTDGVLLGAWIDASDSGIALDIGTGTGVIAMMMAQRFPRLRKIFGVEIDADSARQAQQNTKDCEWADRLTVIHSSIQEFSQFTEQKFDRIVSNPPFFTGGTLSHKTNRNIGRHTILLSPSDLLLAVHRLLSPEGTFQIILPPEEGRKMKELARLYGLFLERMTKVYSVEGKAIERWLMAFSRDNMSDIRSDQLVIRDQKGEFTSEYRLLTRDFYLNF